MKRKQLWGLVVLGILIIGFQVWFSWYKKQDKTEVTSVGFSSETEKTIPISEFDPNDLDAKQWEHLGFSERQVATILKYKSVVGGRFISKQQLAKCYAISSEKFLQIEPYLLLPETSRSGTYSKKYSSFHKKSLSMKGRFNPNDYTLVDWVAIGFSENQAKAILKYKAFLGGSFRSKEKFAECFVISEKDYNQLAPYLILEDKEPTTRNLQDKKGKPKVNYSFFDPNDLSIEDWQHFGFSEKQAQSIIKYRDYYLKGSFKTLEEIEKCYMISPEKFQEMKPWIRISPREKSATPTSYSAASISKSPADFSKIDLNTVGYTQLIEFGFDERSAAGMLSFRKKLGGFVAKQQILETYNIDRDLAEKFLNIAQLNPSNVPKYNLVDAPESFLKNHPYFRRYADKIMFLRISYPSEKELWKKLAIGTEDQNKMKLYLK